MKSGGHFLACAATLVLAACSRPSAVPPPAPAPFDNSYSDLESGSTLKIILPLLKSGSLLPDMQTQQVNANTFNVRANDLIGYTAVQYAALGNNEPSRSSSYLPNKRSKETQRR